MAEDGLASALIRNAIHRLRFTWVPFEAGAPSVDWSAPFGTRDALGDLAAIAGEAEPRALYAAAMSGLAPFIAEAAPRLSPGRYTLDSDDAGRLRTMAVFLADMGAPIALGVDAEGGFTYTVEHAALLPLLRWEFEEAAASIAPERDADTGDLAWPVPSINFKRPYSEMTHAESDMAATLGLLGQVDETGRASLPPEVEARMATLHLTMPATLRVLVLHGGADGPTQGAPLTAAGT